MTLVFFLESDGRWFYNRAMSGLSNMEACGVALSYGEVMWGFIKLLSLHLPAIFFCITASRAVFKSAAPMVRPLFAFVLYFLVVGAGCLVVPLSFLWLLLWSAGFGVIGCVLYLKKSRGTVAPDESNYFFLAAFAVFFAALLAASLWSPEFDHDPMTYQLHFAASWLQGKSIDIIPTPFGDPSHAYGPQLASLFYMWLLAPLPSDMLAINGGAFFLLVLVLAVAGLAKELGAEKGRHWTAALFLLLCPLLVHQGRSALNDVATAAFFVSALFFFMRSVRLKGAPELFAGILCAGLLAGCKYTAAPLVLLLVPPAAAGLFRAGGRKAFFALALGLAVAVPAGGWWYLRNWAVAGSPVFPLEISFFEAIVFPGLYGSEQMADWVYHRQGLSAWLYTIVSVCSPALMVLSVAACAGTVLKKRGLFKKNKVVFFSIIYLALLPVLIDRLFWNLLPFQVNRFWIPAAVLLCSFAGAFYGKDLRLFIPAFLLSWAALFLVPQEAPILERQVLLSALLAAGSAAAGLVVYLLFVKFPALGRHRLKVGAFSALVFVLALAWLFHGYPERRHRQILTQEYGKGRAYIGCLQESAVIAYTGANTPYLLHGPRFRHRVVYVGANGKIMPLPHEFVDELKQKEDAFNTPEPMMSNLELCPGKWAEALREAKADYLFVMALPQYPLLNAAHFIRDKKAWPVEYGWAASCPRYFRQVHGDRFTRIFKIDFKGTGREPCNLERHCDPRPLDAVSACANQSTGQECRRFFPGARRVLSTMDELP